MKSYVRFHIEGANILATCDIPALPFVPRHLYTVLNTVGEIVDRVDDELAGATGGSTLFEDFAADDQSVRSSMGSAHAETAETAETDGAYEADEGELPEELLALIHLENEETIDLQPAVVARLMRHDRTFILDCIRLAEEQMIVWIAGAENEDSPEEKEARLHESRGWEATVSTLRGALHAVVAGQAAAPSDGGEKGDDDEVSELEFQEHLNAWAHALDDEIDSLEPGETLFVTADAAADEPRVTLSVSRYLDTGVLARITWNAELDHPGELLADLGSFGWHLAPATGSTGPARMILLSDTTAPEVALACLSGLVSTGSVGSLDDLSIDRTSETGDWRRLPDHIRVDVSSFDELRSSTTAALEDLGAHPALIPGIRLESSAANHSVTVEVDTEAPILHIVGPVVSGADPDLIESASGLLPDTGFDWLFDGGGVVINAALDAAPFQPGHLEIVLAAAEDVILVHSRALATECGGRSAIEDYLAEAAM